MSSAASDVQTITADLVQVAEAERVVHEVHASWGTPDVLVNNAAATFIGEFLDIPVSRWKTALGLNLLAPVTLVHGFLPDMLERDAGRIINITSAAARTRDLPSKDVPQLSYASSKAALDAFSYGLMHDLAARASRSTSSHRSCSPNRWSTTSPDHGSRTSSAAWRPWVRSEKRSPGSPTSRRRSAATTWRTTTSNPLDSSSPLFDNATTRVA